MSFGEQGRFIQVEFKPGDAKRYTYEVPDEIDVAVGDWVQIPSTGFEKGLAYENWRYVAALGKDPASDYPGPFKSILAVSAQHPADYEQQASAT